MRENINITDSTGLTAGLVDITSVSVDKNLPRQQRCAEYKRQIKDPHRYICGKFTVTAVHPNNDVSLEDCLRGMMA